MIRRFLSQIDPLTRRNFNLDFLSAGVFGLYAGLLMPFIVVIGIRLGASNLAVGLLSAAPCAASLLSFHWASVSQDRPKLPFVVWPNIIGQGLIVLVAFVASPWPYTAIIIAFWLITSVPSAPYAGLMEAIYPADYRGRLLGYVRTAMAFCQLIAVFVAGPILDALGYRIAFPIAAGLGVLSSVIFARVKEPASDSPRGYRRTGLVSQMRLLKEDRAFALWELGFFIFGVGNLSLAPLYPIFQVKYLGLSNAQVGIVAALWAAAWMVAYPVWGSLVDRRGPGKAIIASVVLFGACGLSYFFGQSLPAVLLASVFSGVGEAAIDIGWMNECMKLAPGRVSLYSGVHLTLLGVRGTIGPLLGSALAPLLGLTNAILVGALVLLLGLAPMLLALKREDREGRRVPGGNHSLRPSAV